MKCRWQCENVFDFLLYDAAQIIVGYTLVRAIHSVLTVSNQSDFAALKNLIKNNLAQFSRLPTTDNASGKAAVVIAIVQAPVETQAPCILLTRRASRLRKHAGQYALPGGKVDQGETTAQAALRELHEELGVQANEDQILGALDDYSTRSGFCITPMVVWIGRSVEIQPNPDEVESVFYIPLQEIADSSAIHFNPGETTDRPVFSLHLPTVGHEIYAPTSAMIYQFHQVAVEGKETRVNHFDAPRFAWR